MTAPKKPTKSEQIMVRMRSDQVAALRQMAEADDRSVAYIVRKAVDYYLKQLADAP